MITRRFRTILIAAAAVCFAGGPAAAQFPSSTAATAVAPAGGPVQVGVQQAQVDDHQRVAIVQAMQPQPATAPASGGVIQLSAFGWLQPYVDSLVQALIALGFGIFARSRYGTMMDSASRDALEAFVRNRASSLIADGAVKLESKAVTVNNALLNRAASEAATAIPNALKRFGLTPDVVAQKIIDAIPQTPAGAAMIAAAHAENGYAPVPVNDRPAAAPVR